MHNLPEKMTAVVNHGPGDFRIERLKTPTPSRNEIIISMEYCGICASDIKAYKGAERYWEGEDPFLKAPVIPGHEFVGKVVALGENGAENFGVEKGDLVTVEPLDPCGNCLLCRRGKYWMCEEHNIYGFKGEIAEGGFAEYVKIRPNSKVHKISGDFPSNKMGALIEPFANGLHAVKRANIEFDDFVVLAGAGSIGLSMVQFINLKNPSCLAVLDIEERRLDLAQKMGADLTINPSEENAAEKIKGLTDGYGCDIYIEGTGSPEGVKMGLHMLRRAGTMVEFSVFSEKTEVDWSVVSVKKELDIKGAHLTPYTYPPVIDLFKRRKISGSEIVTHVFPLEKFEEALNTASSQNSIKVLLQS